MCTTMDIWIFRFFVYSSDLRKMSRFVESFYPRTPKESSEISRILLVMHLRWWILVMNTQRLMNMIFNKNASAKIQKYTFHRIKVVFLVLCFSVSSIFWLFLLFQLKMPLLCFIVYVPLLPFNIDFRFYAFKIQIHRLHGLQCVYK